MPETLLIERVRVDGGTQIRVETDVTQVESYAEDMAAGDVFPPIVVYFDGSEYWLADGFHRIVAAKRLGLVEIETDVRAGTRRDAILYAVGANASHGLKRTNRDKVNAVMTLLRDPEWSQWSNYEIAGRCNVSDEMVRQRRASLPIIGSERTYTNKHGTTSTMNTAAIGARPNGTAVHDGTGWREIADPDAERNHENYLRQTEQWRQTDIEDFVPPPEPLPFPAIPVGSRLAGAEIRKALETIADQIGKLSPAEVVEAAAGELWTDAANAEKAIPWLTEFARLVPDEMSERERTRPYLKGYRRGSSGY
jgi:ParB-like nuclease domain